MIDRNQEIPHKESFATFVWSDPEVDNWSLPRGWLAFGPTVTKDFMTTQRTRTHLPRQLVQEVSSTCLTKAVTVWSAFQTTATGAEMLSILQIDDAWHPDPQDVLTQYRTRYRVFPHSCYSVFPLVHRAARTSSVLVRITSSVVISYPTFCVECALYWWYISCANTFSDWCVSRIIMWVRTSF